MSIPTPPKELMRNMLHIKAKRFMFIALTAAVSSTVAMNLFYVYPRYKKYKEYFANYDAYERMKEICSYKYKYMHTCPSELAKIAEENGISLMQPDQPLA